MIEFHWCFGICVCVYERNRGSEKEIFLTAFFSSGLETFLFNIFLRHSIVLKIHLALLVYKGCYGDQKAN